MIYLASPYSNNPDGNYLAMISVCRRLLQHSPPPLFFCPVTFYHPIGKRVPYEAIMELCLKYLIGSDQLVVVGLPDWQESRGVAIEMATWHPRPILLMDPETFRGRQIMPKAGSA